jgi:antitoxin ChpS
MIRSTPRHERIAVNPDIMGGKPCIKGTRIPVDLILRYLGDGQSIEDIQQAFPGLTHEDIRAAETCPRAMPHALLDAVVSHFDPLQVILFGSRARGDHSADSDADVAVVLAGPIGKTFAIKSIIIDDTYDLFLDSGVLIQPWPLEESWLDDPALPPCPHIVTSVLREGIDL